MRHQKNRSETLPARIWKRHSLSVIACAILALWLVLYLLSEPKSHAGSFFGNAIADWTGVVITVVLTKWFFEKGSQESRQPPPAHKSPVLEFLHEHSLIVVLLLSGASWVLLYSRCDPDAKWGAVVSNIVSEWTQQIGLVVLTKKLIETGSKESHQ